MRGSGSGPVPDAVLHLGLATVTLLLSLIVHYADQATLYPLIYMWPALYAFYFFATPTAVAHLAVIGVAYGIVLSINQPADATIRLVLVLGTPLVIGLLISRLLSKMREGMRRSARQERALRSSEKRTRQIVDSARDGFISTDAEGRVLDVNAAAEALLGRPRAELLGVPFQLLGIPQEEHERFDERRRALLEGASEAGTRHLAMRVSIDRPDGTRLRGETMIWVAERDGKLMFNARLTDIGDRLREQEERERLVAAEAALEQAEHATTTIVRLQAVADAALTHRHFEDLLPAILRRTREVLDADAAAVLLREDGGSLSLWSSDDGPAGAPRPDRVRAGAGIAGRVLVSGEPVLVQDPTAGELADPALLDAEISSILALALGAPGELIGVIEVGVRAPRRLSLDDVDLLRLTADRVALAIDHARAYGREHRIAETLQRSLLPQGLPSVPGAVLAARYLPAAAESEVGGDWYDAIALPGGRILLVMGDVSGKGLAAASTLGALRNAIRAYALDGHPPARRGRDRRPGCRRGVRPPARGGRSERRGGRRRRVARAAPRPDRGAADARRAQPSECAGVLARPAASLARAGRCGGRRRARDRDGLQRGVHERDRAMPAPVPTTRSPSRPCCRTEKSTSRSATAAAGARSARRATRGAAHAGARRVLPRRTDARHARRRDRRIG